MVLKALTINLDTWGPNKGCYNVTIYVEENQSEIKLVLPPEMGHALVLQTKELIHKFTKRAADQLHAELTLAMPETPAQLGNTR